MVVPAFDTTNKKKRVMQLLDGIIQFVSNSGAYVFYFLLTLTVVVLVHELGHFLTARLFKMKVERFSIVGLGPPVRLEPLFLAIEQSRLFTRKGVAPALRKLLEKLSWLRKVRLAITVGETEYCISWIPFGGYVKIAGMIDESLDKEMIQRPPEEWEFRSKPAWQRLIVLVGGVTMNFLLAVVIFWGIALSQGKTVQETTEIGYIVEGSEAAKAGLLAGDRILRINDRPTSNWDDVLNGMYFESLGRELRMQVSRGGAERVITVPGNLSTELANSGITLVPANTNVVITSVDPGKPADALGLKAGDIILRLDTLVIRYDARIRDIVRAHAEKPLFIEWRRGSQTMSGTVTPTAKGQIGIGYGARYAGPISRVDFGVFEALKQGIGNSLGYCRLILESLWLAVSGKTSISDSVGGPLSIAQIATQSASYGLLAYLGFLAMLSLSLAIFNIILPIPVLDGGQVAMVIFEEAYRGITGKGISDRTKLSVLQVGMVLVIALMLFAVFVDFKRFF